MASETVKPRSKSKVAEKELIRNQQQRPYLRCKHCLLVITHSDYRISVNGSHEHLQCNPYGITFVFGCFDRASGCLEEGVPTSEHTWFAGYRWQIVLCQGCGAHMGWRFNSSDNRFFGLLLGKLTERGE